MVVFEMGSGKYVRKDVASGFTSSKDQATVFGDVIEAHGAMLDDDRYRWLAERNFLQYLNA